jgi:N-acetylglucosaminyldiphosphoundecaprenol N-acetyl-beta-D-mannosaminyltransferase
VWRGARRMSNKPLDNQFIEVHDRSLISLPARRHSLLGITVDAVTGPELIELAAAQIESGSGCLLFGNHNLHSLDLYHRLPEMKDFYDMCDLAHIDGMSLIIVGKWMGFPLNRSHRTTYLDWIHEFLSEANMRGWRLYVIGGTPEFANALPTVLRSSFPSLHVATHHGYISLADDDSVVQHLTAFSPDVVMVGMGMPQQEAWIVRNRSRLPAKVIFSCGAAYEYLTGAKKSPPRWAGQLGIEWLFRLITEPRRLARRYLVEPFGLIPLIAQAVFNRTGNTPSFYKTRSPR